VIGLGTMNDEMESSRTGFPAIEIIEPSSEDTMNDSSSATCQGSKRKTSLADILAAELERTVEVQDRRYRMKVYKNAFIGSDACTTLLHILLGQDLNFTRHHALLLGRYIDNKYGLFEHVTHDHDSLKDDYLFYRFTRKSKRKVPPPSDDEDGHYEAFLEKLLSGREESELHVVDEVFDEVAASTYLTESIALSPDVSSSDISVVDSVRSYMGYHTPNKRDGNSSTRRRHQSPKGSSKGSPSRSGFKIGLPNARSKSPVRTFGSRIPRSLSPVVRPFSKRDYKKAERSSSLFDIQHIDLQEAANAFEIGVEVKTHRYRGKAFKGTFVGTDAVDVLIATRFATSRTMAEKLGQTLARVFNLFQHVTQDHGKRKLHEAGCLG
jgi:hypothetical protein